MTTSKSCLAEQISCCIAKLRLAAGLTQYQVAEKLGLGYEAVSRMERGVTIPSVIRLADLAEMLAVGFKNF